MPDRSAPDRSMPRPVQPWMIPPPPPPPRNPTVAVGLVRSARRSWWRRRWLVWLGLAVLALALIGGGAYVWIQAHRPTVTVATAHVSSLHEVTVPGTAIHHQAGQTVVYVVVDGRVIRQPVTVSSASGTADLISAGLTDNAQVVVSADAPLEDGQAVRLNSG